MFIARSSLPRDILNITRATPLAMWNCILFACIIMQIAIFVTKIYQKSKKFKKLTQFVCICFGRLLYCAHFRAFFGLRPFPSVKVLWRAGIAEEQSFGTSDLLNIINPDSAWNFYILAKCTNAQPARPISGLIFLMICRNAALCSAFSWASQVVKSTKDLMTKVITVRLMSMVERISPVITQNNTTPPYNLCVVPMLTKFRKTRGLIFSLSANWMNWSLAFRA